MRSNVKAVTVTLRFHFIEMSKTGSSVRERVTRRRSRKSRIGSNRSKERKKKNNK